MITDIGLAMDSGYSDMLLVYFTIGSNTKRSAFVRNKYLKNKTILQHLSENETKYSSQLSLVHPCIMSSSSNVVIGDGVDEILLSFRGRPEQTSTIQVMCGDTPSSFSVTLDANGYAEQIFSCGTAPTRITFENDFSDCEVRAL